MGNEPVVAGVFCRSSQSDHLPHRNDAFRKPDLIWLYCRRIEYGLKHRLYVSGTRTATSTWPLRFTSN